MKSFHALLSCSVNVTNSRHNGQLIVIILKSSIHDRRCEDLSERRSTMSAVESASMTWRSQGSLISLMKDEGTRAPLSSNLNCISLALLGFTEELG